MGPTPKRRAATKRINASDRGIPRTNPAATRIGRSPGPGVLDTPHDLDLRALRPAEPSPDRVLVSENEASQRLVDDRDLRRRLRVALRKVTARQQRKSRSGEEPGS